MNGIKCKTNEQRLISPLPPFGLEYGVFAIDDRGYVTRNDFARLAIF
jgi:hypothetical protein